MMNLKFFASLICILALLLPVGLPYQAQAADFNAYNICSIFQANRSWKKYAFRAEKKWGTPVEIFMAIIFQESSFRHDVRPKKKRKFLIFTVTTRNGDSLGYAQATKGTWSQYKKESGRRFARRKSFKENLNFIGWYNHKSHKALGIKPDDTFNLYLAYHEGWSGYRSKKWKRKKIKGIAEKVDKQAQLYAEQLVKCSKERREALKKKRK